MAIPYTLQTWTDGSGGGTPVSAARMAVIEGGIRDAHYMPAVRVFHGLAQSITSATLTALAFNSERYDTASNTADTMHDTVTNNSRLTCRYAGKYNITANIEWAANATNERMIQIKLNGITVIAASRIQTVALAATPTVQNITTIYDLAVNDYVECVVYQDSGGALNVSVVGNYSPEFMMVRVA